MSCDKSGWVFELEECWQIADGHYQFGGESSKISPEKSHL